MLALLASLPKLPGLLCYNLGDSTCGANISSWGWSYLSQLENGNDCPVCVRWYRDGSPAMEVPKWLRIPDVLWLADHFFRSRVIVDRFP